MSSNKHHIDISRSNYEEYFLLYTDNELTLEEKEAVDAFVLLHPDLQEELQMLMETRLEPADISFGDTSSLLAENFKAAELEESLLLYIDGELEGQDKTMVEKELKNNTVLQEEYTLLLQTKLSPADKIAYPNKEELYRHTEEERKRPFIWWRVAAAVVVLLGASTVLLMNKKGEEIVIPVAKNTPVKDDRKVNQPENYTVKTTDVPGDKKVVEQSLQEGTPAIAIKPKKENNNQLVSHQPVKRNKVLAPQEEPKRSNNLPVPEKNSPTEEMVISHPRVSESNLPIEKTQLQNSTQPVINPTVVAYNPTTATASEPQSTVYKENTKQGSVRGFLRKATRFIEKRTGLKTTNENDQLAFGPVAIKL